jgi:plastocyanin
MRHSMLGWFVMLLAAACGDAAHSDQPSDTSRAGASGAGAAGSASELDCSATVQLLDYKLSPAKLELGSGSQVLCTENAGQAPHDLALRDANGQVLGRTPKLAPGERAQFSVDLQTGMYTMYCTQPGHESLGMSGPVSVK